MPKSTKPTHSRGRKPAMPDGSTEPHELALPRIFPIAGSEIVPEQIWRIPERHPHSRGPWTGEPDRLGWTDAATGYSCLILRQHTGALSGYVAVPFGHPLWGFRHDAIPASLVLNPHRGLTYSQYCDDRFAGTPAAALRICHVDHPGRPVDLMREPDPLAESRARSGRSPTAEPKFQPDNMAWWLGFSTDRPGDLRPNNPATFPRGDDERVYRDLAYVFTEVVSLASQLHALAERTSHVIAPPPTGLAPPPDREGNRKPATDPAADGGSTRAIQDRHRDGGASSGDLSRQVPKFLKKKGGTDEQA
ncbi:hypothetical protein C0V72_14870 [Porphyrobacter sp. TH134]|uniref:hypothetical protein n=1 Tax=Porphyrobacter sp. TH134 TaxID=2067450 RepID=UPI000C7E3E2F|nr:hypothetical protein [Porphyrobacter sp. TH134]PLK22438.1 hypothetical protein C0V72_14870 [Porphyrobacter sp. TH134]